MLRNLHQITIHSVFNVIKTQFIYSPVEILENCRFHNENINSTARLFDHMSKFKRVRYGVISPFYNMTLHCLDTTTPRNWKK